MAFLLPNKSICRSFFASILLFVILLDSFSFAQASLPVTVASADQVQAFVGSRDVKLLFISAGDSNVYFIDYSEVSPSLKVLDGMKGANFVDISPDGKWLTYQTGKPVEGPCATACTTSLWIRPFAVSGSPVKIAQDGYVPRFVVNALDTPSIVYSTAVDCPRDSFPPLIGRVVPLCFKSGMVLRVKTFEGAVVGTTDTVFKGGSYYGGISYDGRYLCTGWPGGINPFMLDLSDTSAGPQLMHRVSIIDSSGRTFYANIGACNISRSPSRIFTNTMLYYDFGLPPSMGTNPLWGNWEAHSLLFIARRGNMWGETLRCYGIPPDQSVVESTPDALGKCVRAEWSNPEWSNHPYYAIASLLVERLWKPAGSAKYERTQRRERIYAINLKDRNAIRLITTLDTSYEASFDAGYPALWIKIPEDFSEDPTWLAQADSQKSVHEIYPSRRIFTMHAHLFIRNYTLHSFVPISEIRLFDVSGKVLWSARYVGRPVNNAILPRLRHGLYFVKVTTGESQHHSMRWPVK